MNVTEWIENRKYLYQWAHELELLGVQNQKYFTNRDTSIGSNNIQPSFLIRIDLSFVVNNTYAACGFYHFDPNNIVKII